MYLRLAARYPDSQPYELRIPHKEQSQRPSPILWRHLSAKRCAAPQPPRQGGKSGQSLPGQLSLRDFRFVVWTFAGGLCELSVRAASPMRLSES